MTVMTGHAILRETFFYAKESQSCELWHSVCSCAGRNTFSVSLVIGSSCKREYLYVCIFPRIFPRSDVILICIQRALCNVYLFRYVNHWNLRKSSFFRLMRMSPESFKYRLNVVGLIIDKKDNNCRKAIPAGKRLCITLHYLAYGGSKQSGSFSSYQKCVRCTS